MVTDKSSMGVPGGPLNLCFNKEEFTKVLHSQQPQLSSICFFNYNCIKNYSIFVSTTLSFMLAFTMSVSLALCNVQILCYPMFIDEIVVVLRTTICFYIYLLLAWCSQLAYVPVNPYLKNVLLPSFTFFLQEDFNVDTFVVQCRRRVGLESLRDDLSIYLKTLQSAMIELINKDYADFVNLSSNLV